MKWFQKPKIKKPLKFPLREGSLVTCNFPNTAYEARGVVTSTNTEEFSVNWIDDHPLAKFAFTAPIKWEWGWLVGDTHGNNPVSRIRKVDY